MESAWKFLGSVPIVPLPGGKWAIGLSKLKDMSASNILDRHTAELNRLADNDLRERFPWAYPWYSPKSKDGWSWGVSAAEIQNVVTEINNVQQGGKTVKTLNDLSPTSQATLTAMYWGKTEAESKLQTFVDYHTNNTYAAIRQEGSRHSWTPTAWKTNADALKFSKAQLDIAVRSDPNWISWAECMVSWSVQTSDWVFMVDYLGWKAVPGNQQYEIVDRLTYEDRHFPAATPAKGMESITKNDYDKYSAQEKQEFEKHLKEIEEELAELNDINNKAANQRTQDEQYKLDKLKNLGITQAGIDAIKKALWIS